jgi:hypothetical protein
MLYQIRGFAFREAGAGGAGETPAAGNNELQPPGAPPGPTIRLDRPALENGGEIAITGAGPANERVYIEVFSEKTVRTSWFDTEKNPVNGKVPYVLYMTHDMPAFYKILIPSELKETYAGRRVKGGEGSLSAVLAELGAGAAYSAPARMKIESYQADLLGSVIGSRGSLLPGLDPEETRKRSLRLMKTRFRKAGRIFAPVVETHPDGGFSAILAVEKGSAPGRYTVEALTGDGAKIGSATFENRVGFPNVYLSNAGMAVNAAWPFLLALAIGIFGVLMGAGGGFLLNPILVSLWPLPHTVVAGTVMPTILFSQVSGIYSYSRIKFINWRFGASVGLAMLLGGFIGPKLTELISLEQYKFVFGWVLLVLAGLMLWQTTPGYLERNKKEQAILKEFRKKAEEAAAARK